MNNLDNNLQGLILFPLDYNSPSGSIMYWGSYYNLNRVDLRYFNSDMDS